MRQVQRERGPAHTWRLDFWPAGLWDDTLLLRQAAVFVGLCCCSPGEWTQSVCGLGARTLLSPFPRYPLVLGSGISHVLPLAAACLRCAPQEDRGFMAMIGLFLYFSTLFLPRVFRPKQIVSWHTPDQASHVVSLLPRLRLSGLCGGVLDPLSQTWAEPPPLASRPRLLWFRIIVDRGKNRTLFFKWNLYFGIVRHAVNKGFILLYFDISKASSRFRELKKPSDPKTVQQLGFS